MRALIALVLASVWVGCQDKPNHVITARDRNRALLNRIADECGLPRETFQLLGDDHVQMQPSSNAKYESVDCALGKVLPNKTLKLGFVGNEYHSGNEQ